MGEGLTSPTDLTNAHFSSFLGVFALLEKIFLFAMIVAKEWYGVGHHPDVASATVVVRFVPLTILEKEVGISNDYNFDWNQRI